uniref:Endonuclease n=2 Tax=root TaxID=1 RepID=A0A8S5LQP4_9CAUD|nr:MAG TPA: endonuclease [Siphoviridae sp. ctTC45]
MLITKKIRLKPTTEQEILFRKSAGVSRWAYNFFLGENERIYREYIDNGKVGKKSISEGDVRKYINNVLKPTTHSWLKEVGSNVMKQGVKDASLALQRYFKGLSGKPKFKSKHKDRPSFYVNYESLSRKQGGFQGEKIGFVKTSEALPKLNKNEKYSNPRITFDGKYWYLSVGYEVQENTVELTGESLGIDLGVKDLAICSNGKVYKNINKTQRVKKLEKKLKREQRKLSRKIENNIQSYKSNRSPIYKRPLKECQNVQKQNRLIRNIHRKLANIRQNYLHQTTTEIVKTKPSRIVMESLNVSEMMKNKHLSKAIQQQKFYEFKRQIEYKSKLNGIEFIQVDKFYPSSKTCSCCGNIKKDLKLSDRMYKCDVCGLVIDRDYNASINLANYEVI